jgi:formate hydrogenlyase subunit 4
MLISGVLILLSAVYFTGIVALLKAKLLGMKGPGLFQPLRDIKRLLKKGNVYSHTTSFIFQIAPSISLATVLTAILLIPFNGQPGIMSFDGDFIIFSYLIALGKFFMIISALDTGSSFEGMGANREALYSMLVEPAFFIMIGSFAFLTGNTSFYEIYANIHFDSYFSYFLAALAVYVLAQVAMVENSRMPLDDPKTHLELTMIHEVMVLDNSGFDLGLTQIASSLKFALFGALIANFMMPPSFPIWLNIIIFMGIQLIFAVTVALLETFRARAKMSDNPLFLLMLTSISILIFFTVLIINEKFTSV